MGGAEFITMWVVIPMMIGGGIIFLGKAIYDLFKPKKQMELVCPFLTRNKTKED